VIEDAIDRIVNEWKRQRPELDVSATEVLQRITRIYLLQATSFAEVFGDYGLTFGEYEVLAALRRSDPPHQMKPTELIAALVLSSGAVTNRIDQVEEAGLVRRLPDPGDRRGTLVRLTERGLELVDRAVLSHLDNEERLLSGLNRTDRDQLAALLRRLLLSSPFADISPERPRTDGRGTDGSAARRRSPRRR